MTEQLKLESDEVILATVRKHWLILISKTALVVIAAVMPFIFFPILLSATPLAELAPYVDPWIMHLLFLGCAWLLISWMVLFSIWTDYYLDMWIVTTKRVIAIDQQGFFKRRVASFRLERLQNLTVDIRGVIETLLNFGNITAETAGNTETFIIRGIPDPRGLKALIQEHADEVIAVVATPGEKVVTPPL
jgi:uncharacterized membrane protein YdbT with pleckstrin-like domain